ncbi:MAG: hypothetical protein JOZ90_00885 [Alphaproteobacteria bacterium]|nr:hypothetical protein [Alphaproteobacteria bacterium]MBV9372340.1 hypothetical protein [Alphaproteobacteria bacterium]MBV9899632.1 hypothetical protein [Alphaproteobacteria bacterium]
MGCPVVHWQMLSADPEATSEFYGALFGWSFSEADALGYRTVETGAGGGVGGGVGGGIWQVPAGSPEGLQLYIQVPDVDAALAQVRALGGQVIMERRTLPDGDAIGLAVDPWGRSFGLTTPARAA